jgi:hypothetical protein
VCLGHVTNNIAEYNVVIKFLINVISLGIRHLVVRLDLQLIVLQLSNFYVFEVLLYYNYIYKFTSWNIILIILSIIIFLDV